MPWIKVEDRLPEENIPVLCIYGKREEQCVAYLYKNGTWYSQKEDGAIFDVTHWLPLPPKPNE